VGNAVSGREQNLKNDAFLPFPVMLTKSFRELPIKKPTFNAGSKSRDFEMPRER
jgi:hypothetical protein